MSKKKKQTSNQAKVKRENPKPIRNEKGKVLGYRIECSAYVDGVRKRRQETHYGIDRNTALRFLAKRRSEAAEGKVLGSHKVKNPTVQELSDNYLEATPDKKSHGRDLTSAKHITRHLGKRRFKDLVPMLVEEYRRKRWKEKTRHKRPPREASLNREVAYLKRLCSWAYENQEVDELRLRGVKMLNEDNIRDRILSDDEYARLLDASPPHRRNIVECAYETGMRVGEILALRWKHVQPPWIVLDAKMTKAGKSRHIPISDRLGEILDGLTRGLPKAPVFVYEGKPILRIDRSFKTAKTAAGLEDFHFHDLRHCFVTRMHRNGAPKSIIKKATGHATDSMFDRYRTIDQTDLNELVKADRRSKETKSDKEASDK